MRHKCVNERDAIATVSDRRMMGQVREIERRSEGERKKAGRRRFAGPSLCACVITKRPGQRCLAEPRRKEKRRKQCGRKGIVEDDTVFACGEDENTQLDPLGLWKRSVVMCCGGEERR